MRESIISRKDAAKQGLRHYFTGEPCKRGHIESRLVSTSVCLECARLDNVNRREYKADYYRRNREAVLQRVGQNYRQNIDKKRAYASEYQRKNLKKIIEHRRERAKYDPVYALKERVRGLIKSAIQEKAFGPKSSKTTEILGCSQEFFRHHIERQFLPGMSWSNFDQWHIDHVVPISSAESESDVYRLNHYTNLRPLWAEENLKKSNKSIYLI